MGLKLSYIDEKSFSGETTIVADSEWSEFLKNKYLPGIISGELIGCIGITEPDTGSDVKNIKTRAEDKGDYFLINGSKTFITNQNQLVVVLAFLLVEEK